MQTFLCRSCGERQPIALASKSSPLANGGTRLCRPCATAAQQRWANRNPDKVRENNRVQHAKWRENHPRVMREPSVTPEGRLCSGCRQRKPAEAFHRDARSKDNRAWRCKTCVAAIHAKWREENLEHVRDTARGTARRARVVDPDRARRNRQRHLLKKLYGITLEILTDLFERQRRVCAICGAAIRIDGSRRGATAAQIDHDHITGIVRGLLCTPCNLGIGSFRDRSDLLFRAATYLHSAV